MGYLNCKIAGVELCSRLVALGVVPDSCRRFEMHADANGVVVFKYEVFANDWQIETLVKTLEDLIAERVNECLSDSAHAVAQPTTANAQQ